MYRVTHHTKHSIPGQKSPLINADAVFTVDLNDAEISYSQDNTHVYITIPEPELDVYLDQSSTKILAEKQNFSWTVNAEDGLRAYLNTMTETEEKVKKAMENYDLLMSSAKESAKNQVYQLATAICNDRFNIHVQFK